jgi:hypothetical protein
MQAVSMQSGPPPGIFSFVSNHNIAETELPAKTKMTRTAFDF